jgi:hypothetical protein
MLDAGLWDNELVPKPVVYLQPADNSISPKAM